MFKKLAFIMILASFVLAACGSGTPSGTSGTDDAAAKAVEAYLTAKVKVDQDGVRRLLCSEKERDLETEATTFLGVTDPKLEGMRCASIGDDKVKCEGKITAQYGTETNEFPLVTYRVVQEDGEWKWCGETK
jgi:predicted small secreted protein